MTRFTLHHGDSREVLKGLPEASVDSIVTDPPYHLTNNGGGPNGKGIGTPYARARAGASTAGFMGMTWDGGDVAQSVELWLECLRVLKPGGHLLAFSGTRTYHRMVCAIEDAGFEIRDQIGWVYGSGFPKSHNGEWGGTALKPAWEPIVMARKPLIGTVEENWRTHGTGALNIDGCRIEAPEGSVVRMAHSETGAARGYDGGLKGGHRIEPQTNGRWPANLIHDGSDEVVRLFPNVDGGRPVKGTEPSAVTNGIYGEFAGRIAFDGFADTGSAARFFYCSKASSEDRHEGLPHPGTQFAHGTTLRKVENTATKGNHHPTVKPTDLMAYLCRLVTPKGGTVLDPFMGSGSTGKAAMLEGFNFIGVDMTPEYVEIARARIEFGLRQGHQPSLLEAA